MYSYVGAVFEPQCKHIYLRHVTTAFCARAFAYIAANQYEQSIYEFEIIQKSWFKRRRFVPEPKPVNVTIDDFRLRDNSYCNMHVAVKVIISSPTSI